MLCDQILPARHVHVRLVLGRHSGGGALRCWEGITDVSFALSHFHTTATTKDFTEDYRFDRSIRAGQPRPRFSLCPVHRPLLQFATADGTGSMQLVVGLEGVNERRQWNGI